MYLRKCTVCGVEAPTVKELSLFKHAKKSKYNRENICKMCANTKELAERSDYYKEFRERNPKSKRYEDSPYRDYYYKKAFGIDLKDYNYMLTEQNNRCWICGLTAKDNNKRLAVDHCHTTGKVRGLLCNSCNRALGMFKDDISYLQRAILYLSK